MTAQRRGRNGYVGRRRQKPAPQRQVAQTDSEDESSDEGSVTRCVCGESHNVGLMVQCDQCEVWQHCDCVGLEEQDIPEQYYCEECKPENHSVVKLTHGRVRRSYSSDGRSATSSAADKKAPKKRMTFNSREALMSLEDVLAARNALEFGAYTSSPPGSPKGGNENAQDQSTAENKDKGSSSSDKEEKKKNSSDANDNAGSNKEDDDAMEVEVETSRPSPRGKKTKRANSSRSNNNNNNNKNENDLGPNTKPARVEKRGGRGGARRTNSTGSRRGQNSKPRSRTSTPQPGDQSPANNSTSSSSIIEKLSARESSPPAKIRYPSAKMSISEMNRRAKQILEYISSIQVEMATNSNSPCIGKSNNNNSSNDGGNNSVPASSTIATTTTTATTSVTTTVKQEQTTTTAQQETVPSPMEIDPLTKTEETTVIVESNIQQKNGTKPSAIVIPEKREDGPSSSLSSASTLPLEENPSGEAAATATQEHLHKEKSTAEEAIAQSMQEQEAKKEQTSLEIMDMLTRELIKFQRRFGAGSACHGSSKHHHHRSSNKEEDSEGETTTRVTRSQETSANSTSAGTTTTTAAGGGGGLLIEKNAAHA